MEHITQSFQKFFEHHPIVMKFARISLENPFRQNNRLLQRELETREKNRLIALVERELHQKGVRVPFLSVSHSRSNSKVELAVIVAGSDQNLGVDLEPRNRMVSARALQRIATRKEQDFGLSPIELWVIKEAAFKSNPKNLNTVIPRYILRSWDQERKIGEVEYREPTLRRKWWVQLEEDDGWIVALAKA